MGSSHSEPIDPFYSVDRKRLMEYHTCISNPRVPVDAEPAPWEAPLIHMCHVRPDEEPDGFNPRVLPRGKTIELHIGHGLNFGNRPGIPTAYSMPIGDAGDDVCIRYRLRNHSILVTGPMYGRELLKVLSTSVRREIGRTAILHTRIFGKDHQTLTKAAERYVAPEPWQGLVCSMWCESARVLEMEPDPLEYSSDSELFRRGESFGESYKSYLMDVKIIDTPDDADPDMPHYQAIWTKPFRL